MDNRPEIASLKSTDIRAEAYAVETDYNALVNDKKILFSNGGFRRPYRNDVEKIHPADYNNFKVKREVIEVNRTGLYDSFPELLFHRSKKSKQFKTVEDLREDHLFNNEIEENTRRFFWPLDLYLTKAKCHIYAHEAEKNTSNRKNTSRSLQNFWGIPSFFSKRQITNLSHIMPYAKEICMNTDWIEQTFKLVLEMDVSVTKSLKSTAYSLPGKGSIMGSGLLGNNTAIGNTLTVTKYGLEIAIGPMETHIANSFARGKKNDRALAFLIENFVPLDFNIDKKILLNPDTWTTLESEPEKKSILGLTSKL